MEFMALVAAVWTGSTGFVHIPSSAFSSEKAGDYVVMTALASSDQPFQEVIPSWNATWKGGSIKVELKAVGPEKSTPPFQLGAWTLAEAGRSSVKDQELPGGKVLTDTLVLDEAWSQILVTLTLSPGPDGALPELKDFYLSLASPGWQASEQEPFRESWGTSLPVPTKAQHDYPKGNVLCSPTSVSMLMNYRASQWQRPDLAKDVPEIQKSVFDPGWGGTGNWPFNMAYPGSFDGVRAFVTRLSSLRQAEQLIAKGIPIACSVDYKKLLQKDWEGDSGHLVVLIGFTTEGDPIINDPAKGPQVRQIYKRKAFAEAWASSKNTVYIVAGKDDSWPAEPGPWPSSSTLLENRL
jgi:hypothetical protein